jgi:hypothetical protein
MELLLIAAALSILAGLGLGAAWLLGFVLGTVYARYSYLNGAEKSGKWLSKSVQRWSPFHLLAWICHYRLVVDDVEQSRNTPTLYACGPHGILALSAGLTFLTGRVRNTRLAVHSILFAIPVIRELLLLHGAIDVSEASIIAALARNESVAVVTGGVREMGLPVRPFQSSVSGIVRIAYNYDIPLRHVVFVGEDELMWTWQGEWRWITGIRRWLYGLIRYPFPTLFCPRRRCKPLHTFISKEVDAPRENVEGFAAGVKQAREMFVTANKGP